MDEKLQKVLARSGIGSRREMERWIEQGRVKVNDAVATLGERVSEKDTIKVDNKIINQKRTQVQQRVIAYHKPVGEVCTRDDPEGRKTIFSNLPKLRSGRWISVGRLDLNTSGLLLLTTDGELANRLMHPSSEVEREYAVRVLGEVSPEIIKQLKSNVPLDDGDAHFSDVKESGGEGANHWYNVVLKEGRNREVRRLWEYFGFAVSRLMRIRYGDIKLERRVRPSKSEDLTDKEMEQLYTSVGLSYIPEEVTPKKDKSRFKANKTAKNANRAVYKGKGSRNSR
ncbi:MAG: pseudouridine synthase [Gammaproteobacteria bacterium]|nr:pseudouridine synthase [Gammaproteobacteria bacterium]MCW8987165.1 pseudouridine synthase [Gammaproteobacteria bacterium]MCW9031228.1 pseudouridine synthase [Gammaproteobacteria bacterium]